VHPQAVIDDGVCAMLLIAAWRDLASRLIPNGIPLLIAAAGLIGRLFDGPMAAFLSLSAGVVLLFLFILAHARGLLGGGDVKLIAAIACGLPLPSLWPFIVTTALAGGLLGVAHLVLRAILAGAPPRKPARRGASLLARVYAAERWRIARHGPLPYAVAIACGGLWTLG
jgi:prepilin peptidase CpaA